MSLKIYIAGASAEVTLIKSLIRDVKSMGYEVTWDWTEHMVQGVADTDLSEEVAFRLSCDDLTKGVMPADILWFVTPPKGRSAGAWVELGAALGMRPFLKVRPIVIVSGDIKASIFLRLNDKHLSTEAEVLESLKQIMHAWVHEQSPVTLEQLVDRPLTTTGVKR